MKVLRISYKGKEITRHRATSPLILIGRSPLCDVLLRTPGVGSVQYVFEWIGEGEFSAETSHKDEWVFTDVGQNKSINSEKSISKISSGKGIIFHVQPLKMQDFEFSWVEDRLHESDLSKKIISQQLPELQDQNAHIKGKNIPSVLEVININGEVKSVADVLHFSFYNLKEWEKPILSQFSVTPIINEHGKSVQLTVPSGAQAEIIHQDRSSAADDQKSSKVTLHFNDLLHINWDMQEYYFRIVPKVVGPAARRSLVSDPFYLISSICVLIGAFLFYILHQNSALDEVKETTPPRIAQIEVVDPIKPPPPPPPDPPPSETVTLEPQPMPLEPPKPVVKEKPKPDDSGMMKDANREPVKKMAPVGKKEIQAPDSKKLKDAPQVVDKNKGGLDNPAEQAPVNRTGFLAALKKNKNVGMVKADQVLDNGIITETVKGDKGDFVLEQSPSGIVNNQVSRAGDALSAASTKVNMKDRIGSGSFNAGRGDVLKEGFKANYGISGEGGLSGDNFGDMMDAQVEGGLDKASVQSAIRGYRSEIRACYERALMLKSGVGGRVTYKFQINANGSVAWINVFKSDVDSNSLVQCVQNVVNGITFPKAKNKQNTIVIYPFQFARKGTTENKRK